MSPGWLSHTQGLPVLTPQDPQILPASVYPLPAASGWSLAPGTSGSVPTLGFLRGGHISLPEASHLLESDLAPQPCLSGLSCLLSGQSNPSPPHIHTYTQTPALDSFLPEAFPGHTITTPLPPITTHLCTSGSPLHLPARPDSNRWRHQTDLLLLPTSGGGQPSPRTLEKALVCLFAFSFYCSLKKANRFGEKFLPDDSLPGILLQLPDTTPPAGILTGQRRVTVSPSSLASVPGEEPKLPLISSLPQAVAKLFVSSLVC